MIDYKFDTTFVKSIDANVSRANFSCLYFELQHLPKGISIVANSNGLIKTSCHDFHRSCAYIIFNGPKYLTF